MRRRRYFGSVDYWAILHLKPCLTPWCSCVGCILLSIVVKSIVNFASFVAGVSSVNQQMEGRINNTWKIIKKTTRWIKDETKDRQASCKCHQPGVLFCATLHNTW